MPKRAVSTVKGLHKHHSRGCANQTGPRPAACDCPWYGHYKGIQKGLEKWAGREVDPRSRGRAEAVFCAIEDRHRWRHVRRRAESISPSGLLSCSGTSSMSGGNITPRSTG